MSKSPKSNFNSQSFKSKLPKDEEYGLDESKVYRTPKRVPEYQLLKLKADKVDLRKKLIVMGYSEEQIARMTSREMIRIIEDYD